MTSRTDSNLGVVTSKLRDASKCMCLGITLLVFQVITLPARAADIMVAAAASLTNAFTEIGKAYEKATPDTHVLFNFAPSGELLEQISNGAPEDVFAAADPMTMDLAEKQRLILRSSRANFASNRLLLVVPSDSKLEVQHLQELTTDRVHTIALGIPETVAAGRYGKRALEKAGIWQQLSPKLVFTHTARQTLYQVARGEVDAGLVYATDVATSRVKVRAVLEVAPDDPVVYSIGALTGFGNESRALGFIGFVRSETGRAILAKYGFLEP